MFFIIEGEYQTNQYYTLNLKTTLKLPSSQANKLKSGIKNGTEENFFKYCWWLLRWNSFLHKLLLTNTSLKAFANKSPVNIKQLKTQLHNIGQSRGYLGKNLGRLLKTGLPLAGNVLKPLAKNVLIPLGLIAAPSATDVAIHKTVWIWHDYIINF